MGRGRRASRSMLSMRRCEKCGQEPANVFLSFRRYSHTGKSTPQMFPLDTVIRPRVFRVRVSRKERSFSQAAIVGRLKYLAIIATDRADIRSCLRLAGEDFSSSTVVAWLKEADTATVMNLSERNYIRKAVSA